MKKRYFTTLIIIFSVFICFQVLSGCAAPQKKTKNIFKKEYKKKVDEEPKNGYFVWPVEGKLISKFGNRKGKKHDGIDIGAPKRTRIRAAAAGKVIFSGWGPKGYGKIVIIKHTDNIISIYAHNDTNYVSKGDNVKKGKTIGLVGKTGRASGYHLHFEIRSGTTPIDPLKYLPRK